MGNCSRSSKDCSSLSQVSATIATSTPSSLRNCLKLSSLLYRLLAFITATRGRDEALRIFNFLALGLTAGVIDIGPVSGSISSSVSYSVISLSSPSLPPLWSSFDTFELLILSWPSSWAMSDLKLSTDISTKQLFDEGEGAFLCLAPLNSFPGGRTCFGFLFLISPSRLNYMFFVVLSSLTGGI